ncbi:hypothetical protein [Streptomyces sp. SID2888]|nr:hypothetical protein [Streptomyces sp. SID2888]MYV47387.1 hypothetical protein [Streptomyces sp. SID2888]
MRKARQMRRILGRSAGGPGPSAPAAPDALFAGRIGGSLGHVGPQE